MNINRLLLKRQAGRVNKKKPNTIKIEIQSPTVSNSSSVKVALRSLLIPPKHPINHTQRHTQKTSKILKRTNMIKPGKSLKRRLKIVTSTDALADSIPNSINASHGPVIGHTLERSQRAQQIKKSEQISHFVPPSESSVPAALPTDNQNKTPSYAVETAVPIKSQTELLLERGLQRANAHQEPLLKRKSSKLRRISMVAVPAVILILVVFGGAIFTKLQLQVVSAKAGFNAVLPSYHPAGFGLRHLNYGSGTFASEFQNKNGGQAYTITQSKSAWSTQDLLNNYLSVNSIQYQSISLGTNTIFLYGNGNATWVARGIWYQINSNSGLNESQLIDLANSL